MREEDLDGPSLQKRAEMFKPWLEDEATIEFMNIVARKIKALERQLKDAPAEMTVTETSQSVTVTSATVKTESNDNKTGNENARGDSSTKKIHPFANLQGKIEALERMSYLPQGVIKTYERKLETEKKRKEAKERRR